MPLKQEYEVSSIFSKAAGPVAVSGEQDEVDILQISVARIAEQYMEYLDLMRELISTSRPSISIWLHAHPSQARELLPPAEGEVIEQEEGIYNKQQLIDQLLEYKKYKEAAFSLRILRPSRSAALRVGPRSEFHRAAQDNECFIGTITVFDLISHSSAYSNARSTKRITSSMRQRKDRRPHRTRVGGNRHRRRNPF